MDNIKIYTIEIEIKHKNLGDSFDSFLEDEGILDEVEAVAITNIYRYFMTGSCGYKMEDFHCGMPDLIYDRDVPDNFGKCNTSDTPE